MSESSWAAMSAISAAVSTVVITFTAVFVWRQLREMTKATMSQSFLGVLELLQSDKAREARSVIFAPAKGPSNQWRGTDLAAAERTSHLYNSVGVMVRCGFLPKDLVIRRWHNSLTKSWTILAPLVASYREQRHAPDFWADFEWLALEANKSEGGRR